MPPRLHSPTLRLLNLVARSTLRSCLPIAGRPSLTLPRLDTPRTRCPPSACARSAHARASRSPARPTRPDRSPTTHRSSLGLAEAKSATRQTFRAGKRTRVSGQQQPCGSSRAAAAVHQQLRPCTAQARANALCTRAHSVTTLSVCLCAPLCASLPLSHTPLPPLAALARPRRPRPRAQTSRASSPTRTRASTRASTRPRPPRTRHSRHLGLHPTPSPTRRRMRQSMHSARRRDRARRKAWAP